MRATHLWAAPALALAASTPEVEVLGAGEIALPLPEPSAMATTSKPTPKHDKCMRSPPNIYVAAERSGNLVSLEHVNLNAPDWDEAMQTFWIDALGAYFDSRAAGIHSKMTASGNRCADLRWVNFGLQQFHMPIGEPEDSAQTMSGAIGLTFPDLDEVRRRFEGNNLTYVERVNWPFARDAEAPPPIGIDFGCSQRYLEVKTPTNQTLYLHETRRRNRHAFYGPLHNLEAEDCLVGAPSERGELDSVLVPRLPGGASLGSGMPYALMHVRAGAAAGICRFYEFLFDAKTELMRVPDATEASGATEACVVKIGAEQAFIFQETSWYDSAEHYDGHHVAIYINEFVETYMRAKERDWVWNNPRFSYLTYDSLDDALRFGEFRVIDIIDPLNGEALHRLEHEVRSLDHPGFSCKALLVEQAD